MLPSTRASARALVAGLKAAAPPAAWRAAAAASTSGRRLPAAAAAKASPLYTGAAEARRSVATAAHGAVPGSAPPGEQREEPLGAAQCAAVAVRCWLSNLSTRASPATHPQQAPEGQPPRFYSSDPLPAAAGLPARLEGDEAAHALRALRLGPGDRLQLCDGRGGTVLCEITSSDARGGACWVRAAAAVAAAPRGCAPARLARPTRAPRTAPRLTHPHSSNPWRRRWRSRGRGRTGCWPWPAPR